MSLELLNTGCIIMVIGMGVVFFFLTIMIFAMDLGSFIIRKLNKIFPEEVVETQPKKKKKVQDDTEVAIAVAAAIQRSTL